MKTFDEIISSRSARERIYVDHALESLELAGFLTSDVLSETQRYINIGNVRIIAEVYANPNALNIIIKVSSISDNSRKYRPDNYDFKRTAFLEMGDNTDSIKIMNSVERFIETFLAEIVDQMRLEKLL